MRGTVVDSGIEEIVRRHTLLDILIFKGTDEVPFQVWITIGRAQNGNLEGREFLRGPSAVSYVASTEP